jgi:uncharacterized protein YabN with tetrapyrrole methylase and pyrophosphatase domain
LAARGTLVVVGTGIRAVGQLTTEAIAWITQAERVHYVIADVVAEAAILRLNPAAESLSDLYGDGQPRADTYSRMAERILASVRAGHVTCAVFYGHPGVFVTPSHAAIRQARTEGYEAQLLPGISAEDCLFADLGLDPALEGCQTYEATDFLMRPRVIDPTSGLVLWQIGVLGEWTYQRDGYALRALPLLLERLAQDYPLEHVAIVYEAAIYPGCPPRIEHVPLAQLSATPLSAISTLYVPPTHAPPADLEMCRRLGIEVR